MTDVGKPAPAFALPATGGKTLGLSDYKGHHLVLYFYPKDHTPGCTKEGQDFRDLYGKFQKQNTEILGVSRDSVKTHESFAAKQGFPFPLLSDKEEAACGAYDVIKEKNMYGRKVVGIERSTFVIDKNGVLAKAYRKVKVKGHAEEVLDFVTSLNAG